jgi:type 1 glutamine amidotransferase
MKRSTFLLGLPLAAASLAPARAAASAIRPRARVLIVVGPSTHAPGTHEVGAGGRLMAHCLANMTNLPGVHADLVEGWPADEALLEAADSLVFIGDIFPPQKFADPKAALARLDRLMRRGRGIVCIHYATGLRAEDVAPDGEHPLLHWMGGYFGTRTPHHPGVAKVFPAATITPAAPRHPVCRGWREFTVHDEPYIRNYFGPDGNRPAKNVTIFATSLLPPEAPQPERVAWGIERPDGGRGFGIVMPHFYRNWALEDLRRFILNGIVWATKLDVPAGGVQTALPDLAAFRPASVQPLPPKAKAAPKKA